MPHSVISPALTKPGFPITHAATTQECQGDSTVAYIEVHSCRPRFNDFCKNNQVCCNNPGPTPLGPNGAGLTQSREWDRARPDVAEPYGPLEFNSFGMDPDDPLKPGVWIYEGFISNRGFPWYKAGDIQKLCRELGTPISLLDGYFENGMRLVNAGFTNVIYPRDRTPGHAARMAVLADYNAQNIGSKAGSAASQCMGVVERLDVCNGRAECDAQSDLNGCTPGVVQWSCTDPEFAGGVQRGLGEHIHTPALLQAAEEAWVEHTRCPLALI